MTEMPHCDTCSCAPRLHKSRPSTPSSRVFAVADPSPTIIASLDVQIEQARNSLIQLCRTRNSHLPVSRLLPETLSEIFATVRDCSSEAWVKTTHVSHEWRAVALADLSLWNVVELSKPLLAAEVVRHSQNAPIMRVLLTAPDTDEHEDTFYRERPNPTGAKEALELLSRPSCRVGEFDIAGNHRYLRDILDALFSSSLPFLRVLNITAKDVSSLGHELFNMSRLEDVEQSHIEVLHVYDCALNWNRLPFHRMQSLRGLSISYCGGEHWPGMVDSANLPVLNNFPLLERLSLSYVSQSDESLPSNFRLVLPRLSMLHLDAHWRTVCWIIRHLDIPEICRTVINYESGWDNSAADLQVILESLGLVINKSISLTTQASIHAMSLQVGYGRLEISTFCSTSSYTGPKHRILFRDSDSVFDQYAIMNHVLPLIQSKLVLECEHSFGAIPQDWSQSLATVPASTVHIKSWELTAVITYALGSGSSGHLPFPNMKTFIVEGTIMHYFSDPELANSDAEFFLALKRRADGGTLEKVVFLHCGGLTPSMLDRWRVSLPNTLVDDGSTWVDE